MPNSFNWSMVARDPSLFSYWSITCCSTLDLYSCKGSDECDEFMYIKMNKEQQRKYPYLRPLHIPILNFGDWIDIRTMTVSSYHHHRLRRCHHRGYALTFFFQNEMRKRWSSFQILSIHNNFFNWLKTNLSFFLNLSSCGMIAYFAIYNLWLFKLYAQFSLFWWR